jgi:hypothetical protein
MQALQAGASLVFDRVNMNWEDKKRNAPPEYQCKDGPCPEAYAQFLFQDDELLTPDNFDLI